MIRPAKQIGPLLALVCLLAVSSARAASAAGPPPPVKLATGWQFLLDPHERGLAQGWQLGRTGTGWRSVTVPDVFDPRPLRSLFGGTVGWYRVRFRTPATPAGFAWAIRFEQSRRVTEVWLNGHYLGRHDDPYTEFSLPLGSLTPGASNTIVVRVDNRKGVEPREGWWNWGGLVRPVSLVPLGPVTVSDLGVMPDLTCPSPDVCGGRLLVDAVVANRGPQSVTPALRLTLDPPAGSSLGVQTQMLAPGTLSPGESANLRFAIPLASPLETWSPEHPKLYEARIDALVGAGVSQSDHLAVGMRRTEVRNGQLYLNGRRIDLRGASIEEDVPGRGPALTAADQQRIIDELRALHANVTRSQYPVSEGLLDRLDRAGILIWTQAPIYHRDDLLHTPAQRNFALATLRGAVLATRNHASVLTESIANELSPTPDDVPGTKAYMDAAVQEVRALDPAVPVSIDVLSYPNFAAQATYRQFDLIGISNYYGWYTGKPGHSTASISALKPYLEQAHARYPNVALLMTEFGAESTFVGPAAQKQTFAFQTQYIQQVLATVAALPYINGAIYWTLREFAVKPRWNGGPQRPRIPFTSIHHKGLITYAGQEKPAFGVTARLFAGTPLYPATGPPGVTATQGGPPAGGSAADPWLGLLLLTAIAGVLAAGPRVRRRAQGTRARLRARMGSAVDVDVD